MRDRDRLRVLHVTTDGRIGGAERLIVDIVRASRSAGRVEAAICVLGTGGDLRAQLVDDGIAVHELGLRGHIGLPAAVARLHSLITRESFDVVHTHLLHGSAVGLTAARLAGVSAAVMTRHYERYVWMYGTASERLLHRVGHRLARHIFAISEAARSVCVDQEGIAPNRVSVVPNGIDADRVRRAGGVARLAQATLTIGTVGSLQARKGQADLIAAVAALSTTSDVRLVIVGDGPLRNSLRRLAAELGIADRVTMAGYTANPYPIMRNFDIYAQPSHEEGFGISVLEAMALGLPVVTTTAGGLPELVRHEIEGLLVGSRDSGALAAALRRLIADRSLRVGLGRQGIRTVGDRFLASYTAARYEAGYRRLLRPHGASEMS